MTTFSDLETKELLNLHRSFDFTKWLVENEWQPYWIGNEIYINLELPGRPIRNINKLYDEYRRSQPREDDDDRHSYNEPTDPRDPYDERIDLGQSFENLKSCL